MAFNWDDPEKPQRGGTSSDPYANGGITPITIPPGTIVPPNGGSAADLPHGTAPTAYDPSTAAGLSQADKQRVDDMLQKYGSTDDPNYWYKLVSAHGGVDSTGADWLDDRIKRGDGSQLVKDGTVQKFQDSGSSGNPLDSSLLAPYTKTFDYAPFQAPTDINEQNDTGVQKRLQFGQQALERSAASKGTLLTGGTAKDLESFGQNFASNEYGNVYNRAAQDYNTNRNNAYQQYLGDESTFYANQNNPFSKLLSMATLDSQNNIANGQLGLGYAGLNSNNLNTANRLNFDYANAGGNYLTNGANAYGGYTTQAGNAGAAGSIAGGNAWQNAFGSAGNSAIGAYYNSIYPPNRSPYGGGYNSPGAGSGYP